MKIEQQHIPDFKKLKEHVDKMQDLLNDPHPGLYTWCFALGKQWQKVAEMWTGEPEPPEVLVNGERLEILVY